MKPRHLFFVGLVLVTMMPLSGWADTYTGDGGWVTSSSSSYWNNPSWGPEPNVVCALFGNCAATVSYLGTSGSAPANIYFASSGTTLQAQLLFAYAALAPVTTFGWFSFDPNTNSITGFNPLFAGVGGGTVQFTPTGYYGFYISTPGGVFLSTSNLSAADAGNQHFAFFQGSNGSLYLGAEDLFLGQSDRDYNDLGIAISPVPEPASLTLMGMGLAAGAAGLRKRLRRYSSTRSDQR